MVETRSEVCGGITKIPILFENFLNNPSVGKAATSPSSGWSQGGFENIYQEVEIIFELDMTKGSLVTELGT